MDRAPDFTINPITLDKTIGGCLLPTSSKGQNYEQPCVYAWRDGDTGEIVYIGKALKAKNRLQQHWYQSDWLNEWLDTGAVPVVDVWFVAADQRAAIERSMIDQHAPRYNMRKD
jgi:excinuclease UvrABC nuclease subunit